MQLCPSKIFSTQAVEKESRCFPTCLLSSAGQIQCHFNTLYLIIIATYLSNTIPQKYTKMTQPEPFHFKEPTLPLFKKPVSACPSANVLRAWLIQTSFDFKINNYVRWGNILSRALPRGAEVVLAFYFWYITIWMRIKSFASELKKKNHIDSMAAPRKSCYFNPAFSLHWNFCTRY